jgi:hypothetical protein
VNIAYIVSAYKLPAQLVRLVRRLDGPGTSTYIHVDAKTDERTFQAMTEPLAQLRNVHFLPRHACHWGDFGHVRASLKALRALIESGRAFDYVVLLTGQDYPLRSQGAIAETLRARASSVFMSPRPLPHVHWTGGGTDRIDRWHFRAAGRALSFPGSPFRRNWLNRAWSLPAQLLRLRRSFPAGMQPWGGSSYWMMPADCARYIDEFVHDRPDYVRFFERVLIPDEIFFHTIVMNSAFAGRVAGDDLRYVDWSQDADHPKLLTTADFERMMASSALFARKFDPDVDAVVLDLIDRSIAREDKAGALELTSTDT